MSPDPSALRDQCAIVGIGETRLTKNSGVSDLGLQLEASILAIHDAGLDASDIDGILAIAPGQPVRLASSLGIDDLKLSAAMGLGGASPCAMVGQAVEAITAGVANNVLCFYGANQRSGSRRPSLIGPIDQEARDFEAPYGWLNASQHFAVTATRYMHEFGVTSRQFGVVAVTMRQHASLNSNAMLRQPLSIDDHQASRMVSDPLRLLDCCLETDGSAAVVVSSTDRARSLRKQPIAIKGYGQGYGPQPSSLPSRPDILDFGLKYAAPRAFSMAGVSIDDIDVAELFDCYTFVVLRQLEMLRACGDGEGGAYVDEGNIELDGALPVNTHGGLLSQGHLAGMNHVVEAVRQLRREAGDAQIANPELALVTGFGGSMAGLGSALILAR